MKKKLTKKLFCSIYDSAKKVRKSDPIQFEIIFNDWKRLRQKHI
jgi:hypothetical protein